MRILTRFDYVHSKINRKQTYYNVIIDDFYVKVSKKVGRETTIGSHGTDLRNKRGKTLVDFAENYSLKIIETVFEKRHTENGLGYLID